MRFSDGALADLKQRNPVEQIARKWVTLRSRGRLHIGPCPICSIDPGKRDSTRFECDSDHWVCAVCADGGDVIRLVERTQGVDFIAAVEWLGGTREIDPAEAAARAAHLARQRTERERTAAHARERERRALFGIWRRALPIAGTPAEAYLHRRGIEAPAEARLRFLHDVPFYANSSDAIHHGPAMVAAITGPDGRFAGTHTTWIDLEQPRGKAMITDPASGEVLPSRKVRGQKQAGTIELVTVPQPAQWILGEGIETTLSVWLALRRAGRDIASTSFVSAIDLGNLGGRTLATVPHPTLKTAQGRPLYVPGPEPDLTGPGIVIPASVDEVILLGDGDSDPFLTRCAIARAAKRFARPGRTIRVAWAPPGKDFNDLIRAMAA